MKITRFNIFIFLCLVRIKGGTSTVFKAEEGSCEFIKSVCEFVKNSKQNFDGSTNSKVIGVYLEDLNALKWDLFGRIQPQS